MNWGRTLKKAQWITANALHFGVPIPALRAHVGKPIK
jgi:hypothetical protein